MTSPERGSWRLLGRPSARLLAVLAVTAVGGSALAGLALGLTLGLTRPTPATASGTGGFARWTDHGTDHVLTRVGAAQADEQLRSRGRSVVNGVAGVRFADFRVRRAGASEPAASEVRSGQFEVRVIVEYRLPVDGVRVGRAADARFRYRAGAWELVSLRGSGEELWDHEAVEVHRAGRVLVVGPRGDTRLPGLAALAEQARAGVQEFWDARWPGSAVVVLPSSPRLLDPLVRSAAGSDQVAVTVWEVGADGPVVRVLMNPAVYDRLPPLARLIVLRHEITHVAQDALPRAEVPTWLTEGLAEYVGYRGSGVPMSTIGAELFAQVRASGPPVGLPRDGEFGLRRSAEQRRVAYQSGWTFCEMVTDVYGEDRLVPFYVAVSRGDGDSEDRLQAAARTVLRSDFAEVLAEWRAWLRVNA